MLQMKQQYGQAKLVPFHRLFLFSLQIQSVTHMNNFIQWLIYVRFLLDIFHFSLTLMVLQPSTIYLVQLIRFYATCILDDRSNNLRHRHSTNHYRYQRCYIEIERILLRMKHQVLEKRTASVLRLDQIYHFEFEQNHLS